ncbi:MAG: amidohydrolase family protein [Polyangiaceae bacterium]
MYDLIVKNGFVVGPQASMHADVAVAKGIIAAVVPPGRLNSDAVEQIDAAGKIVVPGGIDPHIHAKSPLFDASGFSGYTQGIEDVSRAAVHGGTTMLIDFAIQGSDEMLEQAVQRREADFSGKSFCDYAYHLWLNSAVSQRTLDEIPHMVAAGYPSVKIFMTDITPSRRGRKLSLGDIWEVLQRVAKAGGIAAIHAEDDELVMHMYERLKREGRMHFRNMAEVHNTLSEDLAFRRIIGLAEHIEGAALYLMHVSAKTGVDAIAESRAKGYPIYGETLHQYALYSSDAYARPHGQIYHTYPSLKSDRDRRALWDGMVDGTIATVATDELCTSLETKLHGERIDDVTGGNSGVEPRMGIMYTEAVVRRGFRLEQFVDLTSANAARLMGLYPKKGALAPGSDADICIIDPGAKFVLHNDRLHETDYTPWEGWNIEGWPTTTIVGGVVVVRDGNLLTERRAGQWVSRKLSESVLFGPPARY